MSFSAEPLLSTVLHAVCCLIALVIAIVSVRKMRIERANTDLPASVTDASRLPTTVLRRAVLACAIIVAVRSVLAFSICSDHDAANRGILVLHDALGFTYSIVTTVAIASVVNTCISAQQSNPVTACSDTILTVFRVCNVLFATVHAVSALVVAIWQPVSNRNFPSVYFNASRVVFAAFIVSISVLHNLRSRMQYGASAEPLPAKLSAFIRVAWLASFAELLFSVGDIDRCITVLTDDSAFRRAMASGAPMDANIAAAVSYYKQPFCGYVDFIPPYANLCLLAVVSWQVNRSGLGVSLLSVALDSPAGAPARNTQRTAHGSLRLGIPRSNFLAPDAAAFEPEFLGENESEEQSEGSGIGGASWTTIAPFEELPPTAHYETLPAEAGGT